MTEKQMIMLIAVLFYLNNTRDLSMRECVTIAKEYYTQMENLI